jgi:hypothetical protein
VAAIVALHLLSPKKANRSVIYTTNLKSLKSISINHSSNIP